MFVHCVPFTWDFMSMVYRMWEIFVDGELYMSYACPWYVVGMSYLPMVHHKWDLQGMCPFYIVCRRCLSILHWTWEMFAQGTACCRRFFFPLVYLRYPVFVKHQNADVTYVGGSFMLNYSPCWRRLPVIAVQRPVFNYANNPTTLNTEHNRKQNSQEKNMDAF